MKYIRGRSYKELIEKIRELGTDVEEIYLNKELSKNLIIEILENCEVKTIYLPESRYKRTNKKILDTLKEIGVEVKCIKGKCGRPTNKKEIIAKYLDKSPEEISKITGINLKTVEYHYYKLKSRKS
jgi:hypothetical protein